MFDTITSRGVTSIIGGFLIALVIGATYLWGIISLYITSYFRITSGDTTLTSETTALVFPFMFFGQVRPCIELGHCYAHRSQAHEKS